MRIKLAFAFGKETLPLDYRRTFMSFIKNSLACYQQESFARYFDKYQCRSKSYAFAVAFPRGTTFGGGAVTLARPNCYLTFSTADFVDIALFYNAFLAQKGRDYPFGTENVLRLTGISYVNVMPVRGNQILVSMLSPFVLRRHCPGNNAKDRYVSCRDDDFTAVAGDILARQLERAGYAGRAVQVEAVDAKMTVISEFQTRFSATIGVLRLTGDEECLNYLLASGMGNRRNAGFGLFTVLK